MSKLGRACQNILRANETKMVKACMLVQMDS
eukprot:UN23676